MKRCSKCDTDKPLEEFHRLTRNPDGRQAWCRVCVKDYQRGRPTTVRSDPSGDPKILTYARNGKVEVACWCGETEKWLPIGDVGKRTRSCGRVGCNDRVNCRSGNEGGKRR